MTEILKNPIYAGLIILLMTAIITLLISKLME